MLQTTEVNENLLNADQKLAFKSLVNFINNKEQEILLQGKAGTGKTFLMSTFVGYCIKNRIKIAVTAPTHKAVNVLRTKLQALAKGNYAFDTYVVVATTHSFLSLREMVLPDGSITFLNSNFHATAQSIKDEGFKIIIVDECSMVNSGSANKRGLLPYLKDLPIKKIYTGDINQINPVKETVSKTFEVRNKLTLNTTIRQEVGNPILDLAYGVLNNTIKLSAAKVTEEGKGFKVVKKDKLLELLKESYLSEEYQENSDFIKVVAWKNVTLDYYNNIIRQFMYPNTWNTARYLVGEKVVTKDVVKNMLGVRENEILIANNIECTVLSVADSIEYVNEIQLRVYILELEFTNGFGILERVTVQAIHEKSEGTFNNILNKLEEFAKMQPTKDKKREAWQQYYKFKQNFALLKYSYAITAHLSQGSTYKNTLVDVNDILSNRHSRDKAEKKRILYTAVTRSSDFVGLIL